MSDLCKLLRLGSFVGVQVETFAVSATRLGWAKCPLYTAVVVALASSVHALDIPSGQSITLHEVLTDTVANEDWVRFRFIAPEITRDGDYEQTANDMTHLCDETAIPYLTEYKLTADVIVISLADRETEFGQADPDAIQFFEAFRVQDNTCIWEDL